MDVQGNSKTGKRSAAPLLISIFWLVSTIGAALGTVYAASPEANRAASEIGSPNRNETRVAHESDNHSAPVQRPMRVVALEALHLKIKSGMRTDGGSQDALLPEVSALAIAGCDNARAALATKPILLAHQSLFSARAPPRALG